MPFKQPCNFLSLQFIGRIFSTCLPIHKNGVNGVTFMGVICIDMLMRDLIGDLTAFQRGEIAYAFMLDGAG